MCVKVMRELTPIGITEPQPGIFVVDFGENLSGFCRLNVTGEAMMWTRRHLFMDCTTGAAGTVVTMHHAEVLQARTR